MILDISEIIYCHAVLRAICCTDFVISFCMVFRTVSHPSPIVMQGDESSYPFPMAVVSSCRWRIVMGASGFSLWLDGGGRGPHGGEQSCGSVSRLLSLILVFVAQKKKATRDCIFALLVSIYKWIKKSIFVFNVSSRRVCRIRCLYFVNSFRVNARVFFIQRTFSRYGWKWWMHLYVKNVNGVTLVGCCLLHAATGKVTLMRDAVGAATIYKPALHKIYNQHSAKRNIVQPKRSVLGTEITYGMYEMKCM